MINCRNWMVHFDSVTILINTCNKISSIVRFFASLRSRLVVKRILEFLQSIKISLTLPCQDSQETHSTKIGVPPLEIAKSHYKRVPTSENPYKDRGVHLWKSSTHSIKTGGPTSGNHQMIVQRQ